MSDEPPGDPERAEEAKLGSEIADHSTEMSSILGDAYRGELDRETTWRSRLDQTTTWGVTVVAAILTWAFSSGDNPHYIILVGILVLSFFLFIEARRYRDYDVYRSRVRLFQQNLLADALDPSVGVEHEDWRSKLSRDYRTPTLKVSTWEATANRLRRIYLPLLAVLLVAWLFRITAFAPNESLLATATIAVVPGTLVVAAIALYYIAAIIIALWPRERHAKGEFREGAPGTWKEDENDNG
ncbi:DUF2270 domain-containing protein [Haloferax sp. DFSO60]|uniref:DUF2270 domain-containing protein n=1 Tax=Haloferax sp. DFSO60 TaxID=3388652 RepID=UPI00397A64E6